MFRLDKSIGIAIIVIAIGLGSFFVPVFAQIETTDKPPIHYEMGILLLDVAEIDLATGSYELEFILSVSTVEDDFTIHVPEFEFVNAKHINEIKIEDIQPHHYAIKVEGTFFDSMDFKDYPFSPISLIIEVEIDHNIHENIIFVANPNPIFGEFGTFVPGWHYKSANFFVTNHLYDYELIKDIGLNG